MAVESKYWNPKTETMPRDQLRNLQLMKLKRLVNWSYDHSLFWRNKLDQVGVKPTDIRTLEDIKLIPFLTRNELAESQDTPSLFGTVLSVIPEKVIRYHQTSGSSGKAPLRIADGWKDWEWGAEMWCYGMYAFGVRPSDVVYMAYNYGTFIGFWLGHYGAEKLGAMTVPGGGSSSEDRIKKIIELGVTVLACTPTYALRLAQVAQEMGIDLAKESKVRLLLHAGEPGASIPSTKKTLSELWGAKVGDFPGMSETGGSTAYECAEQCGGIHIIEDNYIQEVVKPGTDEVLGYGEKGELILTSFGRAAIPLIRYRTGDLVERVPSDFCTCGRTFDLYKGGILGRADDMKLVRGVNVFPSAVENIIRKYIGESEFQIELYKDKGIDQIKVRMEAPLEVAGEGGRQLLEKVSGELYDAHHLAFDCELVEAGTLPKFELKARRLKDLR